MVNKSLIIIPFLMLILTPTIIAAQDVVQTNVNTELGLEIQYPKYDFIRQNQGFKLHTHVFNVSNSLPVHNDDTVCQLHLYNSTGDHTFQGIMEYEDPEFEVYIDGANFSDIGHHAYTLWCNSTTIGGLASGIFEVTPSGLDPSSGYYTSIVMLISSALMFFLWFLIPSRRNGIRTLVLLLGLGLALLGINVMAGSLNNVIAYNSSQVALTILIVLLFFYISILLVEYTIDIIDKLKMKEKKRWGEDED